MDMVAEIFGERWKHVDERSQLDIRCSWEVSKVRMPLSFPPRRAARSRRH
jgi:hypothetical protein